MGKHYKPRNKKIVVLSIIRMIFFIALVVSIIYIIKWYIDSKQNKMLEEKVSEVIVIETEESLDEEYKIDFEKLKEIFEQLKYFFFIFLPQTTCKKCRKLFTNSTKLPIFHSWKIPKNQL